MYIFIIYWVAQNILSAFWVVCNTNYFPKVGQGLHSLHLQCESPLWKEIPAIQEELTQWRVQILYVLSISFELDMPKIGAVSTGFGLVYVSDKLPWILSVFSAAKARWWCILAPRSASRWNSFFHITRTTGSLWWQEGGYRLLPTTQDCVRTKE